MGRRATIELEPGGPATFTAPGRPVFTKGVPQTITDGKVIDWALTEGHLKVSIIESPIKKSMPTEESPPKSDGELPLKSAEQTDKPTEESPPEPVSVPKKPAVPQAKPAKKPVKKSTKKPVKKPVAKSMKKTGKG